MGLRFEDLSGIQQTSKQRKKTSLMLAVIVTLGRFIS